MAKKQSEVELGRCMGCGQFCGTGISCEDCYQNEQRENLPY